MSELARRVAEVMGLPVWLSPQGYYWTSDTPGIERVAPGHGHERVAWKNLPADARISSLPDPEHDWLDFGRVWEWAEKRLEGWDVCMDFRSIAFGPPDEQEPEDVITAHGDFRTAFLRALVEAVS